MTLRETVKQTQWVYAFEQADGSRRELLGGKGAGLADMTAASLPVPPGFIITTEACRSYYDSGKVMPAEMWAQALDALVALERSTGRYFGAPADPLLVSVRSGAPVSMPGMMDTVLNLGLNQAVADGIARRTGNRRFALDLYRRFIQMYGNVVLGIEATHFDAVLERLQQQAGVKLASDLDADALQQVIDEFKAVVLRATGEAFPDTPKYQLERAILAVFDSWETRRAIDYRNYNRIPHDLYTAVCVVAMVFGNMDESSGTGVLFTRDPSTGERILYGEYLVNAQGEDVVAGIATPQKIAELQHRMPGVYDQLDTMAQQLELHYRDAQDVEFTVEQGKLYLLQTRSAKRSAKAAVKMAVDMYHEDLISKDEALMRVEPDQIYQLLLPRLDPQAKDAAAEAGQLITVAMGASPGGATGRVVFTADEASEQGKRGVSVVLVRPETSPDDVHGLIAAKGVLTSRGGATSHAAVVARGLGKPCVSGAELLEVRPEEGVFVCGDFAVREGEEISIDGATGEVFAGRIATIAPSVKDDEDLVTLLEWADQTRRLGVWANADYPRDAEVAMNYGAEGIGLCRTEHMFFEQDRLSIVRECMLAAHAAIIIQEGDVAWERYLNALAELEEFQIADFVGILRAMKGKPVVIRLLDPPMHEFLPSRDELFGEVIELRVTGENPDELEQKQNLLFAVDEMRESNPMIGMRGCRLGLIFPEIYTMQVRAIIRAAAQVAEEGIPVAPEIMIPLVSHTNEFKRLRETLEATIREFQEETGNTQSYEIGTMIEIPRAALIADQIAESAEFFSFGTNDLTQNTFGFSRDDVEVKFLKRYEEAGILEENPFQVVDRDGVGQLISTACRLGRQARPGISMGICGEHGGDPKSIEFFHTLPLDYVSCSPYRVPVARLAAARAALMADGARGEG
ncbi:MAG: pyruvate, phosphate dikinase [Chloroflexi bacterium]|nr:pyruvate, phosphate dikinase [Chloroflexota bacterium]